MPSNNDGADHGTFGMVVEASPSGMIMVDRSGKITLVNQQVEKLFGYSRQELFGQEIEILVPHRFRSKHAAYRDGFFQDPQLRFLGAGRNLLGLRKDGTEISIEIGLNPIHTSQGFFTLASIIDITERIQAENKLRETADALQRINAELEQFTHVASHDLKEPLRKITAFADILVQEEAKRLSPTGKDYIERMRKAAERMQDLIEDLLLYSKVNQEPARWEFVELNEIVRGVLTDLEWRIAEIKAEVDVGTLPRLKADKSQIRQLFQNLIVNALKFHCKEKPPSVIIRGKKKPDGFAEITVEDNGIGIDEKNLGKIFKPFVRLHSREEYEGTGMGLAICQRVVARHGGRLAVKSKPDQGTTFTIELPLSPTGGNE